MIHPCLTGHFYIIEGANSSGKTTLINELKKVYPNLSAVYSVPPEYAAIRALAYNKLSEMASLLMYLSANFEMLRRADNDFVVFDRSLISSFSVFLSRKPEEEWNNYISFFKETLKFMPKISIIFYLTVSEEQRIKRINLKSEKEKEADLNELEWEEKKDQARRFLLLQTNIRTVEIDTSNLSVQDLVNKVKAVIDSVF
jgi:thymidylate kinase